MNVGDWHLQEDEEKMPQEQSRVRVLYKSGTVIDLRCDSFKTTRNGLGELTSVTWNNANPEPLHIGVNEIAAVWQYLEEWS